MNRQNVEMWKDIIGYEGLYQVSNFGQVKSCNRIIIRSTGKNHSVKEKILKQALMNKKGDTYFTVSLSKKCKTKSFLVHRLVAIAFIPNYDNKKQINHMDGNKHNNFVFNLEWCTSKENVNHAMKIGIHDHKCRSKSVMCVNDLKIHDSIADAALYYNLQASGISRVCNGHMEYTIGYKFKFA